MKGRGFSRAVGVRALGPKEQYPPKCEPFKADRSFDNCLLFLQVRRATGSDLFQRVLSSQLRECSDLRIHPGLVLT